MILLLAAVIMPAPSAQADDSDQISLALSSITPTSVSSSGELSISGTLTNTGQSSLSGARIQMWRARGPITNVDALQLALDGQSVGGEHQDLTSADASETVSSLAAGNTQGFTLRASFNEGDDPLALLSTNSVYQVGVRVIDASGNEIGSTTTVMGYPTDAGYQAVTIAQLTSTASMTGTLTQTDGTAVPVFANDHLAQEIASGGRLDLIAQLAETDGVSSIIDPMLWDELTAMTTGYQVRQDDGSLVDGDGGQAAHSFLDRLQAIADNGRAYRCLYGNLDVRAAAANDRDDLLTTAVDALSPDNPMSSLPLAITPTSGTTDQQVMDYISSVNPAVVLSADIDTNTTVYQQITDAPPTQPQAPVQDATAIVSVHDSIYDGGPDGNDAAHRIGRLQAEQLLYNAQSSPAVSVVTTAEAASAELATASGRVRVPLGELVTQVRAPLVLNQGSTSATDDERSSRLGHADNQISLFSALTGQDTGIDMDLLTLQAWSGDFTTDGLQEYLNQATSEVTSALDSGQVSVHISERLVVPSESTPLPISLTNSMNVPVIVTVHFVSDNPSRIDIADTTEISLDPGESATVRIEPEVAGNGTVQMSATVTTATDPAQPISQPVEFIVSANSAGRAAWLIIIGSGVVLLAATALRVRQVRRERAAAHQDSA